MSKTPNLLLLDTRQTPHRIHTSNTKDRLHALRGTLRSVAVEARAYASSHLALRPAASALVLGAVASVGSLLVYHFPAAVGDILAAKVVAMMLAFAALFQLVVATIRSLSVPIIGFLVGFAAENATVAGFVSPYVDPAVFRYGLIACAIGVIGRCVLLRE